jgi:hypothetical protein
MPILKEGVCLTNDGVVFIPGGGYMHPYALRDLLGEDAYQELLARPRIASEYEGCDCPSCQRADAEENCTDLDNK